MALEGLFKTDDCIGHPHVLPYLEQLFEWGARATFKADSHVKGALGGMKMPYFGDYLGMISEF